MSSPQRAYRGRSAAERVQDRRARLLAAGLEIWGEQGWAAVSVRGVCARAGLIDRYFYENFTDRQALLFGIFDHVRDRLTEAVGNAWLEAPEPLMERGRAAITAALDLFAREPGVTRVLLAEPAGNTELERRRQEGFLVVARQAAELVGADLPDARRPELEAAAMFNLGGFMGLAGGWLAGDLELTRDELVERLTVLFGAVFLA